MKREEAIEILNALAWVQCGPDRDRIITAISMAIESLSSEAIKFDFSKLSSGQLYDLRRNKAKKSAESKPTQIEKCEYCIHNGTNKDKITCKECVSSESVREISEDCNPLFFGVDYIKLMNKGGDDE